MALVGKLKAKKRAAKEEGDDDLDTSFDDLGDLDDLDAVARARADENDKPVDYSSDAYTTDRQVNLDGLTAGGEMEQERKKSDFADLDAEDAEAEEDEDEDGEAGGFDLANLEAMPDFDDDDGDGDEEAQTAAKKKKLLLIAGGGVAAAVLIGAGAWLVMGGSGGDGSADAGAEAPRVTDVVSQHGAVVSLENVPMASGGALTPTPAVPTRSPEGAPPPVGGGPQPEAEAPPLEGDSTLAQLGLNVAQEPGEGVVVPSVTRASFASVPHAAPGTALSVAPDPALVEQTDLGILPKIGADGKAAYDAYARPAPTMDAAKPKLAIIVTGVGMSRAATEVAIAAMPQEVTLALDVYARGLDFWVARAREDGHEVLLSVPLESDGFPFSDPGPEAMRVLDAPDANVAKLAYILSRTAGYFGVLADHGGKFLGVEEQVDAMMKQLKDRGVMYVDGGVAGSLGTRSAYKMDLPWAAVEMNLDDSQGRADLERQLQELSDLAQKRSIAVARVSATPLSMTMLSAWIAGLEQQGFQLVPVSALAKKQLIR